MYRHYLELQLKNLNVQLNQIVDFLGYLHDIQFIWDKMHPQVKNQLDLKKSHLNHIRDIVHVFVDIDPKASNLRKVKSTVRVRNYESACTILFMLFGFLTFE